MFNKFRFNYNLLPRLDLFNWMSEEKKEAEKLALEAEDCARRLNGLTATIEEGEIVSVLKSTCLLLQRLIDKEKSTSSNSETSDRKKPSVTKNQFQTSTKTNSESSLELVTKLPTTIQELIKLRDWVLLAHKTKTEGSPDVLSAIYQKLGQILEQEGVTTIEKTGYFDYEKQQVIATQITHDPKQDDLIYETIRPGYLFQDKLIRPQEAIIYSFQAKSAP